MTTHCYIGLEDIKDSVHYIYVHYDGYFSHIVPILRKYYMDRKNVERLIDFGDMISLLLPNELDLEKGYKNKKKSKNRYEFQTESVNIHHIQYFYLFNRYDKWECQSTEMFDIDHFR